MTPPRLESHALFTATLSPPRHTRITFNICAVLRLPGVRTVEREREQTNVTETKTLYGESPTVVKVSVIARGLLWFRPSQLE